MIKKKDLRAVNWKEMVKNKTLEEFEGDECNE